MFSFLTHSLVFNIFRKAEEQWKSKEVYYENRHKELIKTTKAAETHAVKLEKERHAVNTRLITRLILDIIHQMFGPVLS